MSTPERTTECPSEQVICAFARGEISDTWAQLIAGHLCECSKCAATAHRLLTGGSSWRVTLRRTDSSLAESCLHEVVENARQIPESIGEIARRRSGRSTPRRLGRYQIKRLIGVGAFGRVYLAQDRGLDRQVAIKMPYRRGKNRGSLGQIMREARSAAKLRHPGIVSVFDVGRTRDQRVFGVFEYVDGETLDQLLRRSTLAPERAVELTMTIAEALDFAHRHGVIHRDLKPSNIILDSEGHPKIADFGLALRDSDLVRREFVGTPLYMSPEQLRGENHHLDGATDIWSLGVVLYRMLTKRRPFTASSREELYEKILHAEPRSLRHYDPHISAELERICLRCLEKNRLDRYRSTRQLIDDLKAYAEQPPVRRSLEQLSVACKGIRPFDEGDAATYLPLLPGPVDRYGRPASLQFLLRGVDYEGAAEPQALLALFGPTGCGKTSFVRAALLPNLPANITPVVVDTSQVDTEVELGQALKKCFPDLPRVGFVDSFIKLRTEILARSGGRVLIILDHFEQWLCGHLKRAPLVDALRQCDGEHLTCLFVIRSEFWLAANSLFAQLEVQLGENRNYTSLTYVSLEHARRVLTAFGRGCGRLPAYPEDPGRKQQRFLALAVDSMSENQVVSPARLSAFAEIMRDRPWQPASIRHLRGPAGVDFEFLKRCMDELSRETRYGDHRRAAQDVLWALLPEGDQSPGTARRPVSELMRVAGYRQRRGCFEELVAILDQRLKLITPDDPELSAVPDAAATDSPSMDPSSLAGPASVPACAGDLDASASKVTSTLARLPKHGDDQRYYRLSSAYLVGSLREFLTIERRATWSGRMRMRLKELGQAWTLSGDSRHIPSVFETWAIACCTNRSTWKPVERELMRKAWWRVIKCAMGLSALAVITLIPSGLAYRSLSYRHLVRELEVAELPQVPDLLEKVSQARPTIASYLDTEWNMLNATAAVKPSDEHSSKRTRLALATVERHPERAAEIVGALRATSPDQIHILAAGLIHNPQHVLDRLWRGLLQPAASVSDDSVSDDSDGEQVLRMASCLAITAGNDVRWTDARQKVAEALIHARPYQLSVWLGNLANAAEPISAALLHRLRAGEPSNPIQAENLLESLIRLSDDRPDRLLQAAQFVTDVRLPVIFRALQPHENWLRAALPRAFEDVTRDLQRPVRVTRPDLNGTLQAWFDRCGGVLTSQGALATSIPFGELDHGLTRMLDAGYRPNSLRLYRLDSQWFAAVCWNRGRRSFYWRADMTADDFLDQHKQQTQRSLELYDFSDYLVDGDVRFVGLWLHAEAAQPPDTLLRLELDAGENRRTILGLRTAGYALHRYSNHIDQSGTRRFSSLWKRAVVSGAQDRAYSEFFGAIDFPRTAKAVVDCRVISLDPLKPAQMELNETAVNGVQLLPNLKEVDRVITEATAKCQVGRLQEALRDLNRAIGKSPDNLELIYSRGKVSVALADIQGVRHTASIISLAGKMPFHAAYFQLRAELLAGDVSAALKCLQTIEQAYVHRDQGGGTRLLYAYSAALTALAQYCQPNDPQLSAQCMERAIQVFAEANQKSWTYAGAIQREFEFLRTDEKFLKLIADAGFDGMVSLSLVSDPAVSSRWLPRLPLERHAAESARLADAGWTPHCLQVAYFPIRQQLLAGSVWHRRDPPAEVVAARAARQANLALLRAFLGDGEFVTQVMDGAYGRALASQLIARAADGDVNPDLFVKLLADSSDYPLRQERLWCALSRYAAERLRADARESLVAKLQQIVEAEPDAGLRSAAMACLVHWGHRTALQLPATPSRSQDAYASLPGPHDSRNWYRNAVGQTMIVMTPPSSITIGSPATEAERMSNEWLQNRYLNTRYALSATEVTVGQFRKFLSDPKVKEYFAARGQRPGRLDYPEDGPQCEIYFQDACLFCQWLSEQEGIPEDQWCYPGIWLSNYEIPCNLNDRTGYRLPTEAEWEYACRADEKLARYYGDDPRILRNYAWYAENSGGHNQPVAQRLPNEFGFFDMLGNANEWCYEPYVDRVYSMQRSDFYDFLAAAAYDPGLRTVRGGSARQDARHVRSAYRSSLPMVKTALDVGFRVARTVTP